MANKRNTRPSFPSPSPTPLNRAVLESAAPPPPLPPPADSVVTVRAVEPHFHDGIFRDKGAHFTLRLSQLSHLVHRL